ncbi:MAG: D-2-hydroxyacid dehydrogenase, partial [Bacilli bacterium]
MDVDGGDEHRPLVLIYHQTRAMEYARELLKLGYTNIAVASTRAETEKLISDAEVLFCWRFPFALLGGAAHMQWIQLMGAGAEDAAASPHVKEQTVVTRVTGQFGQPIAEYILAFVLYVVKQLDRFRYQQAGAVWSPFTTETLASQTLAVAGIGSIGEEIVRLGRAFHMRAIGLSESGVRAHIVDRHYTSGQWEEFAAAADVLVLSLPLTEATREIVNMRVLSAMKENAILVNIGRGGLIAENDLIEHMSNRRLRAAILDVFQIEPLPSDSPLWRLPNVYITPHVSGPSSVPEVTWFFFENLRRYMSAQPLLGVVDR